MVFRKSLIRQRKKLGRASQPYQGDLPSCRLPRPPSPPTLGGTGSSPPRIGGLGGLKRPISVQIFFTLTGLGRVIQLCLLALLAFGLVCACSGNLPQDSAPLRSQLPEFVKAAPHNGDSPKTQERSESPCRMVKHASVKPAFPLIPSELLH
jgi:hypothetical protein